MPYTHIRTNKHTAHYSYTRQITVNSSSTIGCNIDKCPVPPVEGPVVVVTTVGAIVDMVDVMTWMVEVDDTTVELTSAAIAMGCEVVT